ncbi:methyltransferase [bacterium]|nr:methyltransferase [bacterium]
MRTVRLELALASGAWRLPPSGDIVVMRPRAGDDLSALPKSRVVVRTGFRPDHDHFTALGYRTDSKGIAAALVCLPRARAEAWAMLAEAVALVGPGGTIAIDGQKTDGFDSVLKDLRAAGLSPGEVVSKAHGKFVAFTAAPVPPAWAAADHRVEGFITRPGVFSADGPDRGSQLLVAALPADLPARVGDLGAGWGYLDRAILQRPGVRRLDVVEAEQVALDCARLNVTSPKAVFHWADATTFRPERPWNAVVMNPPFHTARTPDPALGLAFLRAAHRGLAPDGVLWMVANRHLPYEPVLKALFRQVEEIGGDGAFRVSRAAYPVRGR